MPTIQLQQVAPSFVGRLPLTRAALEFALRRHAGQRRQGDHAPFVLHPLEVGAMLSLAGYADHVVAAGVLHDVLENTDTDAVELERRFCPSVPALVRAVSDDPSIQDEQARKSALRSRVAAGPPEAAAIFAADKVSKARERRLKLSCGLPDDEAAKLRELQAAHDEAVEKDRHGETHFATKGRKLPPRPVPTPRRRSTTVRGQPTAI